MRIPTLPIGAVVGVLAAGAVWTQGRGNPTDWPTAYGDAQHTSWVRTDVNISPDTMAQPGFALQWKTSLDNSTRYGASLGQGVVTSAVNLFTPLSTVAGAANVVFAVDNDTGNVFWTRRFEGALAAGTAVCPGGISGAPTRMVDVALRQVGAARGGGGRGGRAYGGAVGEPGTGVPIPNTGARGGRGTAAAATPPAGRGAQAAPLPTSPFPTNAAAVAAAGGSGGGLFRSSGVLYAVSADGMLRTLGLVSGKDVQRPAPFLPAGARFADLIAADGMIYTATSQGCAGVARAIWAVNTDGGTRTVVSWKTNGGDPLGSVAFTTSGTVIVAVGSGPSTAGGYANAVVALDPKTLALKDWFTQPGLEITAPPVVFDERGRNIVAVTTKDGRLLLLDAQSLGGPDHATPLAASAPLAGGGATFALQSPASWQEPAAGAATSESGTRWMLIPVNGPMPAPSGVIAHGATSSGAMLAVKIAQQDGRFSVQPGWLSENIGAPLTPLVVNGVVFVVSAMPAAPARLYALNGTTGKLMWHSGTTIASPVSNRSLWTGSGHVFVGTQDGTLYAFGFDMERGSPRQRSGS